MLGMFPLNPSHWSKAAASIVALSLYTGRYPESTFILNQVGQRAHNHLGSALLVQHPSGGTSNRGTAVPLIGRFN